MMEKTSLDLKQIAKYSPFDSVPDMDATIYRTVDEIRGIVANSVVSVLRALGAASLRLPGISFMKQRTIAKKTGYSRVTVNKSLNVLGRLGIIDSVRTQTAAGRPSVKIYRIKPFNVDTLHQQLSTMYADKINPGAGLRLMGTFEPLVAESKRHLKNDNKDVENNQQPHEDPKEQPEGLPQEQSLDDAKTSAQNNETTQWTDHSYIPESIVDSTFITATRPFISAEQTFRLYGIIKLQAKRQGIDIISSEVVALAVEAFKTTVFMRKMRRIKRTFSGYFFGVLSVKLAALKRRIVAEESNNSTFIIPGYDWLAEA